MSSVDNVTLLGALFPGEHVLVYWDDSEPGGTQDFYYASWQLTTLTHRVSMRCSCCPAEQLMRQWRDAGKRVIALDEVNVLWRDYAQRVAAGGTYDG